MSFVPSHPGRVTRPSLATSSVNGTAYTYVVQSVNPAGHSLSSRPSLAVTPLPTGSSQPPATPEGLKLDRSGHHLVSLSWHPTPGAKSYSVLRTTLHEDGVGGTYPLRTIVLDDAVDGTSYKDVTPSDGRLYSYYVQAANAAGISGPSAAVFAAPVPAPPAAAPGGLTGSWAHTRNGDVIALHWSPVPGAVGYVIYRCDGSNASFKWPENILTTLAENTYTDKGDTEKGAKIKGLAASTTYSYQVTAVNAGGVSPAAIVRVPAH
jgi:hypothetical protein